MRIGLNLLPMVPGIGGGWNYTANLIAAIARFDDANEYVAFATRHSAGAVPRSLNMTVIELPVPSEARPLRWLFENTLFRRTVRHARLDCIHHPFASLPFGIGLPSVVTMFDLKVFVRPDDTPPLKRRYLQRARQRVVSRATIIAPMSRSTADHLHRAFDVSWDRMEVIPPVVGPDFVPGTTRTRDFLARHALPPAFWLAVSRPSRHKNYERLLLAFATIRRADPEGWPLVIRGDSTPALRELARREGIADRLTFLPPLEQAEMPLLYASASALVFPSLFEGGGLAVLEAMAVGCPVVASDIPTTHEFGGRAPLIFDPANVTAIADAMARCEHAPELRERMVRDGLETARQWKPEDPAAAAVRAYRRAVEIGGATPSP